MKVAIVKTEKFVNQKAGFSNGSIVEFNAEGLSEIPVKLWDIIKESKYPSDWITLVEITNKKTQEEITAETAEKAAFEKALAEFEAQKKAFEAQVAEFEAQKKAFEASKTKK